MVPTENAKSVIEALCDRYSRKIILSIISDAKSIEEIRFEQNIPVSTCYRRIRFLETEGIIKKDETIITAEGKKLARYISLLKRATISFETGQSDVKIEVNKPDKLEMLIQV